LFSLLVLFFTQSVPAQCTKKAVELPAAPELYGFRVPVLLWLTVSPSRLAAVRALLVDGDPLPADVLLELVERELRPRPELGVALGALECDAHHGMVVGLLEMRERPVAAPALALVGGEEFVGELPGVDWQRCVVHFERNVLSHVPTSSMSEVAQKSKPRLP